MEELKRLLEDVYCAQVLILGKQIIAEKRADGMTGSSDRTKEALELIRKKRQQLLHSAP